MASRISFEMTVGGSIVVVEVCVAVDADELVSSKACSGSIGSGVSSVVVVSSSVVVVGSGVVVVVVAAVVLVRSFNSRR